MSDSILGKIRAIYPESAGEELRDLSPMLYNLNRENVLTIPDGYFDTLSGAILSKVKTTNSETAEEELRELSPILYSLKDENVYTVPGGYFESFAGNVTQKLVQAPAKVITMKKRTSWLKYAAAAVVTGIITITSFQLFTSTSSQQ